MLNVIELENNKFNLITSNFRDFKNDSIIEIKINDYNIDNHCDTELFLKYRFIVNGWSILNKDSEVIDSRYGLMCRVDEKQLQSLFIKLFNPKRRGKDRVIKQKIIEIREFLDKLAKFCLDNNVSFSDSKIAIMVNRNCPEDQLRFKIFGLKFFQTILHEFFMQSLIGIDDFFEDFSNNYI